MQNGKLLVAECLRSLGKLRLQKGRRCSADEVLRAIFDLRLGEILAKPQCRHEADHRREHKSYHRILPVGQWVLAYGHTIMILAERTVARGYGSRREDR